MELVYIAYHCSCFNGLYALYSIVSVVLYCTFLACVGMHIVFHYNVMEPYGPAARGPVGGGARARGMGEGALGREGPGGERSAARACGPGGGANRAGADFRA